MVHVNNGALCSIFYFVFCFNCSSTFLLLVGRWKNKWDKYKVYVEIIEMKTGNKRMKEREREMERKHFVAFFMELLVQISKWMTTIGLSEMELKLTICIYFCSTLFSFTKWKFNFIFALFRLFHFFSFSFAFLLLEIHIDWLCNRNENNFNSLKCIRSSTNIQPTNMNNTNDCHLYFHYLSLTLYFNILIFHFFFFAISTMRSPFNVHISIEYHFHLWIFRHESEYHVKLMLNRNNFVHFILFFFFSVNYVKMHIMLTQI